LPATHGVTIMVLTRCARKFECSTSQNWVKEGRRGAQRREGSIYPGRGRGTIGVGKEKGARREMKRCRRRGWERKNARGSTGCS
jgi:hypothetical protein